MMAVARRGSGLAQIDQPGFDPLFAALQVFVFAQGLSAGIEHEQAVVTVEQHVAARFQPRGHVVQADDGRDVERTRHDRRVRRAATHVRAERLHELAVEHRGVRWRQVVGKQDVRIIDLRQRHGLPAGEVHHDAAGDIVHVQAPLAQVRVVHLFEQTGVAVGHLLEHGLDVAPVPLEGAQDLVDERPVLDHE